MRRPICLGLCFAAMLLLLSGCYDYKEINHTAMVSGIGIDIGEKGRYSVSVEVIQPSSGEGESSASKVFSDEGDSIEDCLKRLVNVASRELRFSHCKLIVFSDDVANEGISVLVDGFLRDPEYRPDLYLAVVSGATAREMLSVGEKEKNISSYEYSTVIGNSYSETGSVPPTRLYQFSMDGDYTMLPCFVASEDGKFSVNGACGFYRGKKFVNTDLSLTQSILLLSGQYKRGELLLTDGDLRIPCQIRSVETERSVLRSEEEITVCAEISCNIRLTSLPDGFDLSTVAGVESAEKTLSRMLESRISKDFSDSKKSHAQALFGLSVYLYRYHTELYEALKATGGEESVSLSVKCSVRLENSGFSDERIRE